MQRADIVEAFTDWCQRPGYPYERQRDLEKLASADPVGWRDTMLSLVSDQATDDDLGWVEFGLRAALTTAPDRQAMEAELAQAARRNRRPAWVIAEVLSFGGKRVGQRHAIEVLGEDFVFDTWSRYKSNWRLEDRTQQQPDVTIDEWAAELLDNLANDDPDAIWRLFLRYLEHEEDPRLRSQSGIAWLESINFVHASEFIERIEAEARKNARLRAVMRSMYPPSDNPDIERRFRAAMEGPGDAVNRRARD